MKESMNTQERTNAAQAYEAPQVEIIEVKVERGYASTGDIEETSTFSLGGRAKDSNDSAWGDITW